MQNPQDIVDYYCSNDDYLRSLTDDIHGQTLWNDLLMIPPRKRDVVQDCWKLFTRPEETLRELKDADRAGLERLRRCIESIRDLSSRVDDFRNSKVSQCMVELVLWMLKSNDGTLDRWQQGLQTSLYQFLNNVDATHFNEQYSPDTMSVDERTAWTDWLALSDKDEKALYEKISLLSAYSKVEMPKKRNIHRVTFKTELETPLARGIGEFRVLSLGCGPGSDLLAVMDNWVAARSQQTIKCVGVDKQWWPRGAFMVQRWMLRNPVKATSTVSFVQQDMVEFVQNALETQKFHLVTLSFAGFGSLPDPKRFLTDVLKNLLTNDGVFLVMENYVDGVLALRFSENGLRFQPTAVWLSNDRTERTERPIMIGLRMRKNQTDAKLDIKVFYVAERSENLNTMQSNMSVPMQLDALVFAAQAGENAGFQAVASHVKQKFEERHNDYDWTCRIIPAEEKSEDANRYICFSYLRRYFFLLGEMKQPSGIARGRQLVDDAVESALEMVEEPAPRHRVPQQEYRSSDLRPVRWKKRKLHDQDDADEYSRRDHYD